MGTPAQNLHKKQRMSQPFIEEIEEARNTPTNTLLQQVLPWASTLPASEQDLISTS